MGYPMESDNVRQWMKQIDERMQIHLSEKCKKKQQQQTLTHTTSQNQHREQQQQKLQIKQMINVHIFKVYFARSGFI